MPIMPISTLKQGVRRAGKAVLTMMPPIAAVFHNRDIAICERNELRRQLDNANQSLAGSRTLFRPTANALTDLAVDIDSQVEQLSSVFFRSVDQAKERYRLRWNGSLDDALIAVRVTNLLIAKHEYLWGAISTTARPIGAMLDPANQCHLGCPSCSNSFNEEVVARSFKPWPRGLMTEQTFDAFLKEAGLYSFSIHFYNNHEPLLNKLTPSFVRKASDLQTRTFLSTNLSYRQIDAEAIVRSGLDELMVAADGVTQPVYERYRRGGRIDWVLSNARAIAAAKRRLGSVTPILRWQLLSFAHNVHEIPLAIETAKEIGFDTFNVATPNQVSDDDPSIEPVVYAGESNLIFNLVTPPPFSASLDPYREIIESALHESAEARWRAAGGLEPTNDDKSGDRCDWLHLAIISDATGRVVPCCNGDYVPFGRFDFTQIKEAGGNVMNSAAYREARKHLADPVASDAEQGDRPPAERVVCAKCPGRPRPQVGLSAAANYLSASPSLANKPSLHNWSRHQS
jgi:MoaA/NifB/PqqE/SkfB family radical SAM enzyme